MNPTNNDKGFLKIVENNEINNESCKKKFFWTAFVTFIVE